VTKDILFLSLTDIGDSFQKMTGVQNLKLHISAVQIIALRL